MNKKMVTMIPLLLATFSFIFIFITARPAFAASVALSPDHGVAETTTRVSGTGFTASSSYTIYFAYDTTYETRTTGTVSTDGSITRSIAVPEIPGGNYTVRVATSSDSASDTFTVEPKIDISKASVLVGQEITVDGTGFRARRDITVKFDNRNIETATTNSRGSFSVNFKTPDSVYGDHEVTASDGTTRLAVELTVGQSIIISPKSGIVGAKLNVTGTGFRDGREVMITFDDDDIDTSPALVKTDDKGSFSSSFLVPGCVNGKVEVLASDGKYSDAAEFEVLASISPDPNSAKVGVTIHVNGNGFRSNHPIAITFDGRKVDSRPLSIRSDSTGCFEADFTVPSSTSGIHELRADDGAEAAKVNFTTLPNIDVSPSGGPINAEVKIDGTGFGGSRSVTIKFDDEHVRTIAADLDGNFTTQFVVPQKTSGRYNVVASDGSATAGTVFTVTTSIEVKPITGHVGTEITVNGTGFTGAVTVRYDDIIVATVTANNNGEFSVSFNAPQSIHGHHDISVSGVINTIDAVFTMESEAPPTPKLLLPDNGIRQNSRPSFSWEEVIDPSGVTYSLQIAADESFNTLLLEKTGLTQSPYRLTREEGLSSTESDAPYYWRIKAVDGASNESAWSSMRSFYVRYIPQWAIYVIIVAVAVAISVSATRRIYRHK